MSSHIRNVVTWTRTSVSWQATQQPVCRLSYGLNSLDAVYVNSGVDIAGLPQDLRRERAERIEPPTGYTLVRKGGRWEQVAPAVDGEWAQK